MYKTYFNWSSGKDSAMALHKLQKNSDYSIEQLITTINSEYDRVSMHGLRRTLLLKQAESIGIPIKLIELPAEPSMEEYNSKMTSVIEELKSNGYTHSVFGDIFLEDLKNYREKQLESIGIKTVFPLWQRDTSELMDEFIDKGFKAITVCVNSKLLDESFIGREVDRAFIDALPSDVDPCGENGEFHTFCYDGPIFSSPVDFSIGEKVYREYEAPDLDENDVCAPEANIGFWFCDLIP